MTKRLPLPRFKPVRMFTNRVFCRAHRRYHKVKWRVDGSATVRCGEEYWKLYVLNAHELTRAPKPRKDSECRDSRA